MQRVLYRMPGLWHLIKSQPVQDFLSSPLNASVMSRSVFLRQLDNVDSAACSWLALVSGINMNVFHGFETEDELVNYFLNDAYANNVTVIASKRLNDSQYSSSNMTTLAHLVDRRAVVECRSFYLLSCLVTLCVTYSPCTPLPAQPTHCPVLALLLVMLRRPFNIRSFTSCCSRIWSHIPDTCVKSSTTID